jgi:hypothetical protein
MPNSEWPQVWSDYIKDAAVQDCTPEWLLWNRLVQVERERDERAAAFRESIARLDANILFICRERDEALKEVEASHESDKRARGFNCTLMKERDEAREACAKLCEPMVGDSDGSGFQDGWQEGKQWCVNAIRSMNQVGGNDAQ